MTPELDILSYTDFASRIKKSHPEYAEMDDLELSEKIIKKYPQYRDKVDLTLKKKELTPSDSGQQPGEQPSTSTSEKKPVKPVEGLDPTENLAYYSYEQGELALSKNSEALRALNLPTTIMDPGMGFRPPQQVEDDKRKDLLRTKFKKDRVALLSNQQEIVDNLVNPPLREAMDNYVSEKGVVSEDYVTEKNVYGIQRADLVKLEADAQKLFPDHKGLQANYISKAQAEIQFAIDVPREKYQKNIVSAYEEKYGKTIESEYKDAYTNVHIQAKNLSDEYRIGADAEARMTAEPLTIEYEGLNEKVQREIAQIDELIQSSQSQQEIDDLGKEKEKVLTEYNENIGKIGNELTTQTHDIRTRWNRKFKSQYAQMIADKHERLKEEGLDPKIASQIAKVSQEVAGEMLTKSNEDKEYKMANYVPFAGISNYLLRLGTSTLSAVGGSIEGLSQGAFGQGMEEFFHPSVTEVKNWSDLDAFSGVELTGSLFGSMAPTLGVSVAVGVATRNLDLAARTIVVGASQFFTESIDIAGRAKNDAIARTGSEEAGKNAFNKTMEGQQILLPTYALTALPFVNAWKRVKSPFIRIPAGGAVEWGSEAILQEYPQNLQEMSIRETGDIEGFLNNASWQGLKETAVQTSPLALIGAGGAANFQTDKAIKRHPGFRDQYLPNIIYDVGEEFALAHIGDLYAQGEIDADMLEEMTIQHEKVVANKSKGQKYTSLMLERDGILHRAEHAADDVEAKSLKSKAADIEAQMGLVINGKQDDVIEIKTDDQNVLYMTRGEFDNFTVPKGAKVTDPKVEAEKKEKAEQVKIEAKKKEEAEVEVVSEPEKAEIEPQKEQQPVAEPQEIKEKPLKLKSDAKTSETKTTPETKTKARVLEESVEKPPLPEETGNENILVSEEVGVEVSKLKKDGVEDMLLTVIDKLNANAVKEGVNIDVSELSAKQIVGTKGSIQGLTQVEVTKEVPTQVEKTKKQAGIDKIATGLESLAVAMGGVKQATNPLGDQKVMAAVKLIAEGIIETGIATIEELLTELRTRLKGKITPEDIDKYRSEFESMLPKVSGIKRSMTRKEALEAAEEQIERKSIKEIFKEGKQLVESGEIGVDVLVQELLDEARVISAQEVSALIHQKRTIENNIDTQADKLNAAQESGDTKAELSAEAKLENLYEQLMDLEVASTMAGQQQSISLSMRRFLADSEYNLVSMTKRIKAHYPEGIPESVQTEIEEISRKYKEAEAKIRRYEKMLAKKDLQALKDKMAKVKEFDADEQVKATVKSSKKTAKRIADAMRKNMKFHQLGSAHMSVVPITIIWDSAVDTLALAIEAGGSLIDAVNAAVAEIKNSEWYKGLSKSEQNQAVDDFANQANSVYRAELDAMRDEDGRLRIPHSVLKDIIESEDIEDINELVDHIAKMDGFEEFEDRQIRDAISRYGETKQMSKDEISTRLRKMKVIGKLISGLEDVLGKKQRPLRSGLQRDKISDEERRLRNQLKEAMNDLPKTDQEADESWKTALDAVKSRLKNQISDLEKQIDTGKKTPKKAGIKYDAEAESLRQERDRLRYVIANIEGPRKMNNEQRVKYAIGAAERTIKDLEYRIKNKDFTAPTKPPSPPETKELKAARKLRDSLREQYHKLKAEGKPVKSEAQKATEKALVNMNRKILKLEQRINNKEVADQKHQSKVMLTPEIKAAKKRISGLSDELAEMQKEAGIPEQRRLEALKVRTKKRIDDLNQRIEDKNFDPEPPLKDIKPDEEARKLHSEKLRLQERFEYLAEKARQANKTKAQKILDGMLEVSTTGKTLITVGELSAIGRQGLVFLLSKPHLVPGAMKAMLKQTFSEKNFTKWHDDILGADDFALMKASGLYISDPNNPKMLAREEAFMSNFASTFILTKWYVKPSERAYVSYLNELRVSAFRDMAKNLVKLGDDPDTKEGLKEFQTMANYVNSATGRGNLEAFEKAAKHLSVVFFSPRLIASRIGMVLDLLGPLAFTRYYNRPKHARRMIWKNAAAFFGIYTTLTLLARFAIGGRDDEDDEIYVELDPRSSDFGKIRIYSYRNDFGGGFLPLIRSIAQFITGQKKSTKTGKITPLGSYGGRTRTDVLEAYMYNKLAPTPAFLYKLAESRKEKISSGGPARIGEKKKEDEYRLVTKFGDPITFESVLINHTVPLYLRDVNDLYRDLGPFHASWMMSAAFIGMGIQKYGIEEKGNKPVRVSEMGRE